MNITDVIFTVSIGAKDKDRENPGIFKVYLHIKLTSASMLSGDHLADFGMARNVPSPLTNNFIRYARWTGPDSYKAPVSELFSALDTRLICLQELLFPDIPSTKIGVAAKIWCMGSCVYRVMTAKSLQYDLVTVSRENDGLTESYRTFGTALLDLEEKVYSNALRTVIFAFLKYDPALRPTIKQLQQYIQDALSVIDDPTCGGNTDPRFGKSWDYDEFPPEELEVPGRSRFKEYLNPRSPTSSIKKELEKSKLVSAGSSGSGGKGKASMLGGATKSGWRVHHWTPLIDTPSPNGYDDETSDEQIDGNRDYDSADNSADNSDGGVPVART